VTAQVDDTGWDISHYDIDLKVDPDAQTVAGTITLTADANSTAPQSLVLHADGPTITQITVDGAAVTWTQDGDDVQIPTTHASDKLTLTITYSVSGDDTTGSFLGLPWGQPITSLNEPSGARHWLVVRDVPWDKATVTWHTTMPDDWTVIQNGIVTAQDSVDGWTTTVSELDLPLPPYLMVLDAGDFDVWRDDSGAVPVELWAAPDKLDATIADFGDTADIIAFFADIWGAYPWPIYRNVIAPFSGGMEHTTATTLADSLLGSDWAGIINAHEISHHWWGDYLTCASWDEIWLNEGFASFAELRWYQDAYGEDGRQSYFDYQRSTYLDWKTYEGVFSLYSPNYMWGGTVYEKGSLVLDMLRSLVGTDTFDAALRRYADDNAHGAVTTPDLQAAFEAQTGEDWGWYFDQWVYQADDPTYTVGVQQRLMTNGSWQIDLFARQDNQAGSWTMPMDWLLILDDGSTQDASFWVDENTATLSLCLAASLTDAQPDPQTRLLHGGITRDDGAFQPIALTCGQAADPQPGSDTGDGLAPSSPACSGCASAHPVGGLWLSLLALLCLQRRRTD